MAENPWGHIALNIVRKKSTELSPDCESILDFSRDNVEGMPTDSTI
jgi:hypothetical protein